MVRNAIINTTSFMALRVPLLAVCNIYAPLGSVCHMLRSTATPSGSVAVNWHGMCVGDREVAVELVGRLAIPFEFCGLLATRNAGARPRMQSNSASK